MTVHKPLLQLLKMVGLKCDNYVDPLTCCERFFFCDGESSKLLVNLVILQANLVKMIVNLVIFEANLVISLIKCLWSMAKTKMKFILAICIFCFDLFLWVLSSNSSINNSPQKHPLTLRTLNILD